MTDFSIRPEVRQEIEAAVGKPVPSPSAPEFLPFLKELAQGHPELARKLCEGLVLERANPAAVPKALQNQVQQGQARERRRNLVRALFQRQGWQGQWVPDKRKLLLFGMLGALLGVGVLLFTLNRPSVKAQTPNAVGMVGNTLNAPESPAIVPSPPEGKPSSLLTPDAASTSPPQTIVPASPAPPLSPPTPATIAPPPLAMAPLPGFSTNPPAFPPTSPSQPTGPNRPSMKLQTQGNSAERTTPLIYAQPAEGRGTPSSTISPSASGAAAHSGQPSRPNPTAFPATPPTAGASQNPAPTASVRRSAALIYARPTAEVSAPISPSQTEAAPRASLLVFGNNGAQGGEERSSVLFSSPAQAAETQKPAPTSPDTAKPQTKPELNVFSQAAPEQSPPLTQYQRGAPQTQPPVTATPVPNSPSSTDGKLTTLYQRGNPTSSQSPLSATAPNLPNAPTTPASALPSPQVPPSPAQAFAPGQQVVAKLATAVVALEGGQVPVVAESEGAVWIGVASLDAARRVQVAFDRVVKDGQVGEVQAMALTPQGVPGLEAALEEQTPSLASDILRAGLNGVSAYVQGLAGASSSTVLPGGGAVQSKEAPPLGITLLGEIGKLFALPQGQASVVRLARVDKGTPILILVGVGGSPRGRP